MQPPPPSSLSEPQAQRRGDNVRATTASVENVKVLLLEEKPAGSPVGLCAPLRELTGLPCPCPALPWPGRCQCHAEGAARRCRGRQLSARLSFGRDHEGPRGCENGPESRCSAELGRPAGGDLENRVTEHQGCGARSGCRVGAGPPWPGSSTAGPWARALDSWQEGLGCLLGCQTAPHLRGGPESRVSPMTARVPSWCSQDAQGHARLRSRSPGSGSRVQVTGRTEVEVRPWSCNLWAPLCCPDSGQGAWWQLRGPL